MLLAGVRHDRAGAAHRRARHDERDGAQPARALSAPDGSRRRITADPTGVPPIAQGGVPESRLSGLWPVHRFASSDDRGGIVLGWLTRTRVVLQCRRAGSLRRDLDRRHGRPPSPTRAPTRRCRRPRCGWRRRACRRRTTRRSSRRPSENPAERRRHRDFRIDEDGTVHLTVSAQATTLVIFRIGPIKDWAHIVRHASGKSVG